MAGVVAVGPSQRVSVCVCVCVCVYVCVCVCVRVGCGVRRVCDRPPPADGTPIAAREPRPAVPATASLRVSTLTHIIITHTHTHTAPAPAAAAAAAPAPARRAPPSNNNVRSLADLAADASSDEDEDDANEYYTGGEKSGQVVRGAPKDAESLFDAARAAGARDGTAADLGGGGSGSGRPAAFTGAARTLAGVDAPVDAAAAAPAAAAPPPPPPPTVITFYDDGVFTVGDAPPRAMDGPKEAAFMAALARGECPSELDPGPGAPAVAVNLVRAGKPYEPPPKPAYVAFSGAGHTLAGGAGPSAAAPAASVPPPPVAKEWTGPDDSRPTTSLQLRLADGSRLVARFNVDASLADVRAFIAAARPGGPTAYTLLAGVPPVPVDEGLTLEAAGLTNTVLTQKL